MAERMRAIGVALGTRPSRCIAAICILVAAMTAGPAGRAGATPAAGSPRVAHSCDQTVAPGQFTCFAMKRTDIAAQAASPSVTPSGYAPSDLQSAYNLPSASAGASRTVAVVDAFDDPNAESDLATYRAQYGLPACTSANGCFRKVNQYGQAGPLPGASANWAGEISLDLDMVSAICPNCRILLVEAAAPDDSLFVAVNAAVALGAKFVSASWGGTEDGSEAANDRTYLNHPGVVIAAATGDSGYSGGVVYPATSPYAVAVGGTSLVAAGNSRGWSETAWSDGASGCSVDEPHPSYQAGLTACSSRADADVSASADPVNGVAVYDSYGQSGWGVFGGTSESAPIIAAAYALAGVPGSHDNPATYPYAHRGALFDVTSGSTGFCTPGVLCRAGAGWDGPTGLGTPNGVAAFTVPNVITVAFPGDQAGTVGVAASVQVHASDSASGSPLSFAASGLPGGLSIDAGTGVISGTASSAGVFTVTVTATDATFASGAATFTWTVGTPASVSVAGAFGSLSPTRLLDTRNGTGAPQGAVAAQHAVSVQVTGRAGVPASGVSAVVVNVTVTEPTGTGWIAAYADGTTRPAVSNLNFTRGQTVPNLVVAPVGSNGKIALYNGSGGTAHLIADISGYFLS